MSESVRLAPVNCMVLWYIMDASALRSSAVSCCRTDINEAEVLLSVLGELVIEASCSCGIFALQ